MLDPNQRPYPFRFFRAGGFDQVKLDSSADLAALAQLDQKLWAALACPTKGVELDTRTLTLVDTDKDQRVRAPEVRAAVAWALQRVDGDQLVRGGTSLPLASIREDTDEGKAIFASAKQILVDLKKPAETSISVDDVLDTQKIFAETRFNGDGIIPADSADDPVDRRVIEEIIEHYGSEQDRSGKPGIHAEKLEKFFADARAYAAWWDKAEADQNILLLGANTTKAGDAIGAVRAKVDDYFARCRIAAFDPRSEAALNRPEAEWEALAAKDFGADTPETEGFPLAKIAAGRPLPLGAGANPAWTKRLATLQTDAVQPLLGAKDALSAAQWQDFIARFDLYLAWLKEKPAGPVEKLGLPRVREILAGTTEVSLTALIGADKELEAQANGVGDVERIVLYHRDLMKLLRNFVNFSDFYAQRKAIWQAGTLYIDQKSADLCLFVEDAGKHATMAGLAGTHLLYLDCARRESNEPVVVSAKVQVVAAMTAGDTGNLMVGRNGIFYDRNGHDYDATITKIIENPISVRQAFWSPYKKFVRMIEERVAKKAADAEAASQARLTAMAAASTSAPAAAGKPAAPPPPKGIDVGVVAALGVAVGAIGTAISAFATGILKMPWWQIPLLFVGLMLLISGPSMMVAWLKLRRRNLAPILDANGWAVNTRAKISIPFGTTLTELPSLPRGAVRELRDPYAEKKSKWPYVIGIAVVLGVTLMLLNRQGLIWEWTKGFIGSPPAAVAAPAVAPPAAPAPAAAVPKK